MSDQPDAALPPVQLTVPTPRQVAQREMELLGFPITIDPITFLSLDDQGRGIDWFRYVSINRLHEFAGKRVSVCGLMVADRINAATTGDLMKFVTLADHTGLVEAILFPDVYTRFGYLTAAHPILAVTGIVEVFENQKGLTLRAQSVWIPLRAPVPSRPAGSTA